MVNAYQYTQALSLLPPGNITTSNDALASALRTAYARGYDNAFEAGVESGRAQALLDIIDTCEECVDIQGDADDAPEQKVTFMVLNEVIEQARRIVGKEE